MLVLPPAAVEAVLGAPGRIHAVRAPAATAGIP